MEHSGVGFETMKAQFAFCRALDLVPLVRVPSATITTAPDIHPPGVAGRLQCRRALMMQSALANGIKLLQGTVQETCKGT